MAQANVRQVQLQFKEAFKACAGPSNAETLLRGVIQDTMVWLKTEQKALIHNGLKEHAFKNDYDVLGVHYNHQNYSLTPLFTKAWLLQSAKNMAQAQNSETARSAWPYQLEIVAYIGQYLFDHGTGKALLPTIATGLGKS